MAIQNLVSASLTPEAQGAVLKAIADIRAQLGFLLNLQADDLATLVKVGKELRPFLTECHKVAKNHPEILSAAFNAAEFDRDFQLAESLGAVADALAELFEAVGHTLTAVRSDALVAALEVYAAVKLHREAIPGLNGVADSLGVYFRRGPRPSNKAHQ